MVNYYLSEKTVAEIRYLLWLFDKKQYEKNKEYETDNFELILLLVMRDFLKEKITVKIEASVKNNIYNPDLNSLSEKDIELINEYLRNIEIKFLPDLSEKERELTFTVEELKDSFLKLVGILNARYDLPFDNYPALKSFRYFLEILPSDLSLKILPLSAPYCIPSLYYIFFENWFSFKFNLKNLDYKKLKRFLNTYLEKFYKNQLSFSPYELLGELMTNKPSSIEEELEEIPQMKMSYKALISKMANSLLSISKTENFLDYLLEKTGDLKIRFSNSRFFIEEVEFKNYESIYLEYWSIFKNIRVRVLESILYLEKEGKFEFKDMVYDSKNEAFWGILKKVSFEEKDIPDYLIPKVERKGCWIYLKSKKSKKTVKVGRENTFTAEAIAYIFENNGYLTDETIKVLFEEHYKSRGRVNIDKRAEIENINRFKKIKSQLVKDINKKLKQLQIPIKATTQYGPIQIIKC